MGKIIKNGIAYSTASDNAYNINFNNVNTTLKAATVQDAIAELNDKIDNFEGGGSVVSSKDVIVLLPSEDWILDEDSNIYSQDVEIEGIEEDSNPIILLNPDVEATEEELKSYAYITVSVI